MNWRTLIVALAAGAAVGCGGAETRSPESPSPEAQVSLKHDPYAALSEAIRSSQPPLQSLACETYLESDRPPPREEIELIAEAGDPRVRTVAVALLGSTRSAALLPLFHRKLQDADPTVRLAAAFGMAMAGDPSRVIMLRDALASPDVPMRRTAVWLIGLMGNPSAIGMLKATLEDPDAVVVLRAAEALHRLGSDEGVEEVRALTEHDRHQVRYLATRLLGRVGGTKDIPRLEKLYQSRFLDVKFAAIAAAGEKGDFKRIAFLLDMLDASARQLREQAAKDKDLSDMIREMSAADVENFARDMRVLAARELGETAYTPAVDRLEVLMTRGDPLERTAAAASIIRIRSARQTWRARILADRPPPPAPGQGEPPLPTLKGPIAPLGSPPRAPRTPAP